MTATQSPREAWNAEAARVASRYTFADDACEIAAITAEAEAIREGRAFDFVPHAPPAGHGATRVQGTEGRTYGGACDLVHIPDGRRRDLGRMIGEFVEREQRAVANIPGAADKLLCPGCYMIALIDAAVWLAQNNGQALHELGATMARAFTEIAERGDYSEGLIEEVQVVE